MEALHGALPREYTLNWLYNSHSDPMSENHRVLLALHLCRVFGRMPSDVIPSSLREDRTMLFFESLDQAREHIQHHSRDCRSFQTFS